MGTKPPASDPPKPRLAEAKRDKQDDGIVQAVIYPAIGIARVGSSDGAFGLPPWVDPQAVLPWRRWAVTVAVVAAICLGYMWCLKKAAEPMPVEPMSGSTRTIHQLAQKVDEMRGLESFELIIENAPERREIAARLRQKWLGINALVKAAVAAMPEEQDQIILKALALSLDGSRQVQQRMIEQMATAALDRNAVAKARVMFSGESMQHYKAMLKLLERWTVLHDK